MLAIPPEAALYQYSLYSVPKELQSWSPARQEVRNRTLCWLLVLRHTETEEKHSVTQCSPRRQEYCVKMTKLRQQTKQTTKNWAQKILLKWSWMTIKLCVGWNKTALQLYGPAQCVSTTPLGCQQRQNAERHSLKYVYPHTETLLGLHPNPNNHNNVTFSLQLPPLSHPPPTASPPYLSFLMGMRQINVNTGFTYHTVASTTLQGIEWKQTASPFNAGSAHSTAGAQTGAQAALTGCTACSLWGCWSAASVNASNWQKKSFINNCHDKRFHSDRLVTWKDARSLLCFHSTAMRGKLFSSFLSCVCSHVCFPKTIYLSLLHGLLKHCSSILHDCWPKLCSFLHSKSDSARGP